MYKTFSENDVAPFIQLPTLLLRIDMWCDTRIKTRAKDIDVVLSGITPDFKINRPLFGIKF